MATSSDDDEANILRYVLPDYGVEISLPWLYGGRHYLQGSERDFFTLLSLQGSNDENSIIESNPANMIEIGKRALGQGSLEIAEIYFVRAMRTGLLDNICRKRPEPYFYLAEILEKKAEDKELKLLQKQRFLLQAAALYNFVRNYLKSRDTDVELSKKLPKLVSRRLLDIQDNMITLCGGNPLQSRFDAEGKKNELRNLRYKVKELLESLKCQSSSSNQGQLNECEARQNFKDQTAEVKKLSDTVSGKMKKFFASIIDECLALLGTPPCDYDVIVFGCLARNETTPYSDFEWAILTSSGEEECKVFFRNLTNLVHLQVINLGETILPSMNIEAINDEWFYDDVTPRGVSFDGLLPQACKIPLGNMKDFELIHTPEKMAEFQSNEWYQKNWSLADTLLTFSPLRSEKSGLVKAYRNEMDKIFSGPCDLDCCQHDTSSDVWPTRGSCRGLRVLQEDLSRYGDMMVGNKNLDEGKFYDVKKEIYRLPDRVIAALAKFCEVKSAGIFAILDELYDKEIISSEARDNLASALAIAIRLRLSAYLEAGEQGELLSSNPNNKTGGKVRVYHMPTDEELFHFFFVAIPLYDELRLFKTPENIPPTFANCSFFNDSDITKGHIYCRLLKYDKAIKCYERAIRENPENLSAEISHMRVSLFTTHNSEKSVQIRENLDNLLRKIVKNFTQVDAIVKPKTLKFSPLFNHLDIEECRQLIDGLYFAHEIYGSWKYYAVASEILLHMVSTSDSYMSKPQELLLLTFMKDFSKACCQEDEINWMVFKLISFIEEEGVSTRSIVLLNNLGELLFDKGELDKACRCFQRALIEKTKEGNEPQENELQKFTLASQPPERAFYFKALGKLCLVEDLAPEAKKYYSQAVDILEKNDGLVFHDLECRIGILKAAGMEDSVSKEKLALDKALSSAMKFPASNQKCSFLQEMGEFCQSIGEIDNARLCCVEVLRSASELPASEEKCSFLKETGELCENISEIALARQCYHDALKMCKEESNIAKKLPFVERDLEMKLGILAQEAFGIDSARQTHYDQTHENRPSDAFGVLDLALQLPEARQQPKILKLRGKCFLSVGHFRSAAINFTKVNPDNFIKKIDNPENLHEYSEVLIGLIKSEIFCNNVEAAWQVCERAIKLVLDHEPKETIIQQGVKLFYLGVKCFNIMLERGKEKENMVFQAHDLCQQAVRFYEFILMEKVDVSEIKDVLTTMCELYLLLKNISPKLPERNEVKNLFQQVRTSSKRIAGHLKSSVLPNLGVCKDVSDFLRNLYLLLTRFEIITGHLEQSTNLLNESLVQLFSAPLPDFMWFYKEFLPLLQAITATKSSAAGQSRSPFQQAVDMCIRASVNQNKSLNYVIKFLTTLILTYRSIGQAREAMAVAQIGLEIADLMCDDIDSDKLDNRCRMLLHLAQIHQQNSSNPAFNSDEELNHAEYYYRSDRGREEHMVLCKDLSYANFLCERRRFAEAIDVLEDMRNLGELLWNKYLYVEFFSCAFYGAGIEKSVKIDGELFTAVGDVLYHLMVRAYVGMEKKKEAVAACETLTDHNLLVVHESKFGKRPSCKPYLIEDCHRKLLSLLSEEDRHQFQDCDFPLSSSNLAKLHYTLGEYEMAAKYFPKDVESLEMLEMKIFCLRLAGNQLVNSNRGNESLSLFQNFFEMLQVKEGFLDKPLHDQWEILQTYSFANQYYLFLSLGGTHTERENIDAAIQCYERCIELDEDFICGQDIVALLSDLYQIKALTVDLDNEDSRTVYLDLARELFQKLFRKTAELTKFVELKFASLLMRFECHDEALEHFWNVISLGKVDDTLSITFRNVEKPLVDVYLRREIEARGGQVSMPMKVLVIYEIISTYTKMSGKLGAQIIGNSSLYYLLKKIEESENSLIRSMAGYAYMIVRNIEKAEEIFVSVLEMNPGHPPVTEALKSCGDLKMNCDNHDHVKKIWRFRNAKYEVPKTSQNEMEASKKIQYFGFLSLGIMHCKMENIDAAIQCYERCIEVDKDFMCGQGIVATLSELYQTKALTVGLNDEDSRKVYMDVAWELFQKLFQKTAELTTFVELSFASLLTRLDRNEEALAHFYKAVEKAGYHSVVTLENVHKPLVDVYLRREIEAHGGSVSIPVKVLAAYELILNLMKLNEIREACKVAVSLELVVECYPLSLPANEVITHSLAGYAYKIIGLEERAAKIFVSVLEKNPEYPTVIEALKSCGVLKIKCGYRNRGCPDVVHLEDLPRHVSQCEFASVMCENKGCEMIVNKSDKENHGKNLCKFRTSHNEMEPSVKAQYCLFRLLGSKHVERENIDGAIECYERCIELDDDFSCGQDIVATLSELYQTKALIVNLDNEDSKKVYLDLAWELFQKLFQKTAELTTFVEESFASLLTRLGRNEEAVGHFYNAVEQAKYKSLVTYGNVDKPLVDVYIRREIEALSGRVVIPEKVVAAYHLILTLMKLNQIEEAQKVAFLLESVVEKYLPLPVNELISHSMAGYAYKIIGNKEKAAEIFVSVLEKNPGHPPVTEALESCCM